MKIEDNVKVILHLIFKYTRKERNITLLIRYGNSAGYLVHCVSETYKDSFSLRSNPEEITINNIERKTHEFEFVQYIYDNTSRIYGTSFVVFINKQVLYVFQSHAQFYKPFVSLELKGKHSEAFWKRLLNIGEDQATEIFFDFSNHHNFICNRKFLLTMMTYYRLLDENKTVYKECRIKSKNGKIRDIISPDPEMKAVLRNLNVSFQNLFDSRNADFQVAYKKGKNVLSNAVLHKDNNYIFKLDLKDFFPSCKRELIQKKLSFLFEDSYLPDVLMKEFLDVILYNDALFIGSPISGTLANYSIAELVNYIKNICSKNNVTFSIYADDMVFSSDRFISKDYVHGVIDHALEELNLKEYFKLNEKKSIGQSSQRRHITGVSFNQNSEPTTSREISRYIRNSLFHAKKGGGLDTDKVKGKIQYALSVEGYSGKTAGILSKYKDLVIKEKLISKKQEVAVFAK